MDILDTQIKGMTGRIIIWLLSTVGIAIITVMGTYYATKAQITSSEVRIMAEIQGMKLDQRLTDTLQNRDIGELQKKLLVNK